MRFLSLLLLLTVLRAEAAYVPSAWQTEPVREVAAEVVCLTDADADADANGTLIRSYGWRPDGGWETDPLFVRSGSGPSSPTGEGGSRIAYLHNDGQGSPLLATDKQGKVLWQADYSAFGRALIRNDSLNLALRRPGQWEDPETGLYYNTRRYYDPDTGRYLTQDPLGLGGGTLNYYGYTGGNPTNLTDPTGEFIPILMGMAARCVGQCLAWGAAGGLIGAALEYGLCDPVEDATLIGSAAGLAVGCLKECANPLNWIGGGRAKAVKGEARVLKAEPKMAMVKQEASAEVRLGARGGVQANKAAGDAFEQQVMGQLQEVQSGVVQQVTVKTQSGVKTRIDLMGRDASGNIVCTECKASATAPLTKNQAAAFPEIQQSGAVVVGNGKPGFPGGTQIPPSTVNIIRP